VNPAAGDLFPGSLAWSIAGALWTWLLAVLLGATFLPLQRRVLPPLKGTRDSHVDLAGLAGEPDTPAVSRLLSWAVLGIMVESCAWFVLSLLGWLARGPILVVALALTTAGVLCGARRVVRAAREAFALSIAEREPRWLFVAALGALGVVMAITLRLALFPSIYYDDLVYHLGLPRQALLLGSWPAMPEFYHSFMPAAWEITYLLPLCLGGGSGPQFMNVIALALLAVAAYRVARFGGGPAAGLAVTALLLGCSMFVGLGSLASNDLFVGLALSVALERLCATCGRRPIQIGLLAGAAWATKFVALPAIVALGIGAAILPGGLPARRFARMGLVWLVAVLVGIGWTARATLLTGNPVYPSFFGLFGGSYWSDQAASLLQRDVSMGAFPERGALALVLAPLEVARTAGAIGTPGGINLLLPALLVAGLLLAARVRHARVLLLFAGIVYTGWCATSIVVRFAIVLFIALLPFAAALVQRVLDLAPSRARISHVLAAVLLVVAVTPTLLSAVDQQLARYGAGTGFFVSTPRAEMLSSRINLAAAGSAMALTLGHDARILVIGDARLALVPRRTVLSTAVDRPAVARFLSAASSPLELERLLSRNFTHVLVNSREMERWSRQYAFQERLNSGGAEMLQECLRSRLIPVGKWGDVQLYAVPREGRIPSPGDND
jgi:hypothetical protein